MALVVLLHPVLRRLYDSMTQSTAAAEAANGSVGSHRSSAGADARLRQRTSYDFYFALLFIVVLHGFSALKILFILYINFNIAMNLPKHAVPAATWLFNIGVLFANELAQGYKYSQIAERMLPFPIALAWSKDMDLYGGLLPRWEILFNLTVLRLIAFNLDYYWSLGRDRAGSLVEVCYPRPQDKATSNTLFLYLHFLTRQRRSSSINLLSLNEIAWPYPQLHLLSSRFELILPTYSIRLSTSPALLLLSTTISHNHAIHHLPSQPGERVFTEYASF